MIEYSVLGLIGMTIGIMLYRKHTEIKVKHKVLRGLFFGKLIYTDEKGGKLLKAPKYGVQGKPDFIFKHLITRRYIPFEIKSTTLREDYPHEGDYLQLAAYFLIIEELYHKKPPYGVLVYENKSFIIRNTYKLRREVKQTLKEMLEMLEGNNWPSIEHSYLKCKNCVCQYTVCEWEEENGSKTH